MFKKSIIPSLIIIILCSIFLMWIKVKWYSFWMDNNWLIKSSTDLLYYFYSRKIDLLWSVNFTSYSSLTHLIINSFFLRFFGLLYWYYFMYFFLISIILVLSYKLIRNYFNYTVTLWIIPIFIFNLPFIRFFYWQWTITFIIAVIGFLLSLYLVLKIWENNNDKKEVNKKLILIILSSIFITHPFLFLFYNIIIFSLLFFYNKIKIKKLLLFWIWLLFLHLFWILQFLIGNSINLSYFLQTDYSNLLINIFSHNSQLYNSFIFLSKNYDFVKDFFWYFGPIILFIYLVYWLIFFKTIIKNKLNVLWLVLISLILFLLLFSVWPREPLWFIYSYFYDNFWFFSFFRSFSNVLLFLFYIFIIFVITRWNKLDIKVLITTNIIFIIIFVTSMISHWYNNTAIIPDEYFKVKNIIDNWEKWSNILLLPCSDYDHYNWDNWRQDKYFLDSFFNETWLVFYRPTLSDNYLLKNLLDNICSYYISVDELKKYWIKYILLRKDLIKDDKWYFKNFNENNLSIVRGIKNIYFWKYINLYVIENNEKNDFIYKSPIEYVWKINWLNKKNIRVTNNFNPHWKIYLKDKQWLFSKPIFENNHYLAYDYANWWSISKDEIINYVKENYVKELVNEWFPKKLTNWKLDYKYYILNQNWSIDTELTLYFKPQRYFYFWLIVSWITFLLLLIYLIFDFIKNKRKKFKF